jgi:hypothetical protein
MDSDRNVQISERSNGGEVADRAKSGDGIESQPDLHGGDAGGAGLRHPPKRRVAGLCNPLQSTRLHTKGRQRAAAGIKQFRKPLPALLIRFQQGVHSLQGGDARCDSLEAEQIGRDHAPDQDV